MHDVRAGGENPIYAKPNQRHRSNYRITGGDECDEANRGDISGCNASEDACAKW